MAQALTSVFLLALAQGTLALGARPWRVPPQLRPAGPTKAKPILANAEALLYDEQLTDHFNPGAMQSFWSQRYFVNDSFFKETRNGPVFLCVGGEGPSFEPTVTMGDVHCSDMIQLASQRGALILALEHRFYGPENSFPVKDLSTDSLRLLSSFQALADLARFHAFITERYSLVDGTAWVTWGGSYPGMMAGWAHTRYPHLFLGAVASSAPVQAITNYRGYLEVVRESYENDDPLIGGGNGCAKAIVDAFRALGASLKTPEGRRSLETQFSVCGTGTPLEDSFVAASLANTLAEIFPGQTNDPFCTDTGCNIARTCAVLRDPAGGEPLQRLASYVKSRFGSRCLTDTRESHNARLTDTSIAGGNDRIWFWQTCTAYGFYQTCDPESACPFTSDPHVNSLQDSLDDCALAFGEAGRHVEESIAGTNVIWGGLKPVARNLLFVNGEVDPWNAASVQVSPGPGIDVIWVAGASHHAWTHPPAANDPPAILDARTQIYAKVDSWLAAKDRR